MAERRKAKALIEDEHAELVEKVRPKTTAESQQEKLMATLAELGGQSTTDDDILRRGKQLIVPETMTYGEVIEHLHDHVEQLETETRFQRTFRYRPWDGAYALTQALKRVFGTAGIGKSEWTFFGKKPPQLISVQTGVGSTVQVPWGHFQVPMFSGTLMTHMEHHPEYGPLFQLIIDAPRKYRPQIEGLFEVIEDILEKDSIYKGRAIDGQDQAEFLDLTGVDPHRVIYSDETNIQLEANIWSLLRHTGTMRELNMPLKRAVLLEGQFGMGKTLAAFLTAQVAIENGWTFIYCRPGKDQLGTVLATARLYQPAVVFFEDVDSIAAPRIEGDSVTELLDMFDGITAKGTEIVAILTTNHKESIHKGMVRPGRLDAMIGFGALDFQGVERMIRSLVPSHLLDDNIDYEDVFEAMEGFLPAFVKESVDRTMRYAIARNEGRPTMLMTEDFVQAAKGLRPQLDLMEDAKEHGGPESLGRAVERHVNEALDGAKVLDNDGDQLFSIKTNGHGTELTRS
jgi:transitional endoplasmic reticulum ATPase